jgi:hypothetical protein
MAEPLQKQASDRSKALIFFFILVCLAVGLFADWGFGWWWLVIVPAGMIVVSLLGGLLFAARVWLDTRKPDLLFVGTGLELLQLLLATVGSCYGLRLLHEWMF